MFLIMKTVWLNSHRAAKLQQTGEHRRRHHQHAADGVAPPTAAIDLARRFARRSKRLPEEQAAGAALVAVEGYTYSEASELLGVPIGTVANSRGARARRR